MRAQSIFLVALLAVFAFGPMPADGSEAARNKQIQLECGRIAENLKSSVSDIQIASHCHSAAYNKCMYENLGQYYPNKVGPFKSGWEQSCATISNFGGYRCSPCN